MRIAVMTWALTVLAALTLVAWAGSPWWYVESWWNLGAIDSSVSLYYGLLRIDISGMGLGPDGLVYFYCEGFEDPDIFWWFDYEEFGGWPDVAVYIPLWFPFLLLGAPTAWFWWRERRRFPETACQSCGYDLTGAPHERCPECGKEI